MNGRKIASTIALISCGAALTLAACGKDKAKNAEPNNASNNQPNNASNNTTPNNTIVGTNNTTGGTNNVTIPPMPAEFGLEERPSNANCLAFDRPPSASSVTTERAFSNLSFNAPLWLTQTPSPQDTRWFVMEQAGRLMTMPDEAAGAATVFVDIRARVTSGGEQGLLGMAFHPDWPATPEVFLSYTAGGESIISRFTSADAGQTLNAASEQILFRLDQPFSNHNGGQIGFGPDRNLYIGFGDGGSGGDPLEAGQDVNQLLGKFLRIDVIGGSPYNIPADNPFANGGGQPEIFAWGVRNPWRWSFDSETGDLWAGDVGQGEYEEIDIIELGGNYGWDDKEGFNCFEQQPCDDGPWIDPIVAYDHSQGRRSVTGGYVYRGTAIASLVGIYLFADYASGHVYGIFTDNDGKPEMRELFQHGGPISSFGQGQDGELYIIDYGAGTFHRIVVDTPGADTFPRQLSQTGCMDTSTLVPYTVNAPFWSDGATKNRWMAVPDGETITVESNGDWTFPQGTVLVKNFSVDQKLVETRLFMRHSDGDWGGYSYEWNDAGTDATYAQGGKVKTIGTQQWIFPSSGDCMVCHTSAAGRTLGPENAQLDGDYTYPSTNLRANQLATLGHIGMFDADPDPATVNELVDPFGSGDLAARARSYLHTNCSGCHRSGTALRPKFDLTAFTDPLIDDELCEAAAIGGDLGNANARRLVPGDPDNSLLWLRMSRRDANGMPPIGSNLPDSAGADLIREWITGLGACRL